MSRPRRVPFFIFYFLFSENFPVQCEFRPLIPITHRLVRSFIHSLTKKKKTSAGFIHQADVAADEAARRSNQNSAVFFFSFWFKVKIFHWKFDDPLPPPQAERVAPWPRPFWPRPPLRSTFAVSSRSMMLFRCQRRSFRVCF